MESESKKQRNSRIPNFFRLDVRERIAKLAEHGFIEASDELSLDAGTHTLRQHIADKMIENVAGVFGLPLGIAVNFLINGKDYVVPLVVEEPSVVAGLSGAARTARINGGFAVACSAPIITGQVQVVYVEDVELAREKLLERREEILNLANTLHPKMLARGGGAKDIEVHVYNTGRPKGAMLVLHLHVDTRDAMGANVVNGMCEGIASLVESITGGTVFLRILSNLTDRSIVWAEVTMPTDDLGIPGFPGKAVRDGIVLANELARVDPYRATTHNKGIMNGIDAVAVATGNDYRALEAAAHAYAARDGRYRGLTDWEVNEDGDLVGRLEIPIKVGTVGGSLETNPTVRICHRMLGNPTAIELAGIMGCVGLAQNFAAIRALATAGIQQNHMTLHARSVATSAQVPADIFEHVVDSLVENGTIKVWKAKEIAEEMRSNEPQHQSTQPRSSAFGKTIFLGEHAVVYGRPALAVPLPVAVEATIVDDDASTLIVPRWGVEQRIPSQEDRPPGLLGMLCALLDRLNLSENTMRVEIFPNVPRAMGLGGSAAIAVAVIKALSEHYGLQLSLEQINELAYECERAAHGSPSGVDNTLATYGKPLLFQRDQETKEASFQELKVGTPIHVLIGLSGKESLTAMMVAQVRDGREQNMAEYERVFDAIGKLTDSGARAFQQGNIQKLGTLMNLCQGYLNGLQLSTPEIEELVHIARMHGALGAKLTGSGGGGSVVAIFEDSPDSAIDAIKDAGYDAFSFLLQ